MLTENFLEVIKYEGLVAVATCANNEPHMANTWNSYLKINENGEILIPCFGFRKTEANVLENNKVQVTLGTKELGGTQGLGRGFSLDGTARFEKEGADFDTMKADFKWCNRVMIVTVTNLKQTV